MNKDSSASTTQLEHMNHPLFIAVPVFRVSRASNCCSTPCDGAPEVRALSLGLGVDSLVTRVSSPCLKSFESLLLVFVVLDEISSRSDLPQDEGNNQIVSTVELTY